MHWIRRKLRWSCISQPGNVLTSQLHLLFSARLLLSFRLQKHQFLLQILQQLAFPAYLICM